MFSAGVVLPIVLSYCIGSINFSYILTLFLKGIDIRDHGSGNAGATNTFRVIGKGPAVIVGLLDALKGIGSLGIGLMVGNGSAVVMVCGIAAIIGHNWPVFLRFRGGKGIATTIGVTLFLFPLPTIVAGAVAVVVIWVTKYVSLGSIVFTLVIFSILTFKGYGLNEVIFSFSILVLAVVRHRGNISRIVQGKERRI